MARMRGDVFWGGVWREKDGAIGEGASSRIHGVIPLHEGVAGSERWFA